MSAECDTQSKELLDKMLKDNKIVVVSGVGCGACVKAKKILKSANIPYFEHDLTNSSDDGLFACIYDKTKSRYIPQIFINSKFIGGASELGYLHSTDLISDLIKY